MITFKDAWKGPFSCFGPYIMDIKGNMVLTSLTDDKEGIDLLENICDKLNGESSENFDVDDTVYDEDPCMIVVNGFYYIVRGWGYLTGVSGLNLPSDEAEIIQDDMRDWIKETLAK